MSILTPTPSAPPTVAVVPIVSAWYSKINWTQVVAGAAMMLAFASGGKLGLDAAQQSAVIVVIGVIGNIVTWVMRTFFNGTVNPASLSAKPGGG